MVGQLQQELADALKKQSMPEASLEVTTRYHSDLERDKLRLQKELEKKLKTKTQKQNMLALTSKDLHSTWEEHLKSRSHLEERVAQLDEEKAELLQQVSPENSPGTEPIPRRTTCTFWFKMRDVSSACVEELLYVFSVAGA
ncbi:ankyrin repeat domain-containing protein 26-like [Falco cherrug]|uniref:ankyrin repeat domain-containing protein 26-like n=1 Tax=Falco cherrug TaxID=345164 RepID=UPI0024795FA0|nr:ankyrin repeat domain-containing protein 26-like [Falco cherrug]